METKNQKIKKCPHCGSIEGFDIKELFRPGVVLDPFAGSCTVGAVAKKHRREFIGIELSEEYIKMGEKRIAAAQPDNQLTLEGV